MSKLEKSLREWVAAGLIPQDAADRIRAYESEQPESSWVLSGLLILGASVIGIGVISLVAANWREIPDLVKLAGDFLLLGGLGVGCLKAWDAKKPVYFEVLVLFFMIMCLATIGLISQVFHTTGKLHEALLYWALLSVGVAFSARQAFVPFVWAGALLSGLSFSAMDSLMLQRLFHKNYLAIAMASPLLAAVLTVGVKALTGEVGATRAFRAWVLYGGLSALLAMELQPSNSGVDWTTLSPYWPGYALAALTALGIWQGLDYRQFQKYLLLTALGLFLIPFHFPLMGLKSEILKAIFSLSIMSLMAVFLASLGARRFFQWMLSLVGLRFLILYFQAIGGMATTGFGLIVSGGLVIGAAVWWNKYRKILADKIQRWAQ